MLQSVPLLLNLVQSEWKSQENIFKPQVIFVLACIPFLFSVLNFELQLCMKCTGMYCGSLHLHCFLRFYDHNDPAWSSAVFCIHRFLWIPDNLWPLFDSENSLNCSIIWHFLRARVLSKLCFKKKYNRTHTLEHISEYFFLFFFF